MAHSHPTGLNQQIFAMRRKRSAGDLFGMLQTLYGRHPDYDVFTVALNKTMEEAWAARPADLRRLDLQRDLEPDWFQRPDMVGYVFYIDRFSGNLTGVLDHLDYLQELGVTYVHFMPCLKPRPGDNDGGYSVMDYNAINPAYGSMKTFQQVAKALRDRGISLCIDMVLNHTAKEHEWAQKARQGDAGFQDYYLMFDDDRLPKAYEKTLVEVFPNDAPGSFTYYPDLKKWVWTTFNEHQWDLNWANPWVFLEMAGIMLNLANRGADVLRFDAVAFMWKRLGTRCQSEPEVHMILQALRAVSRIVAPAAIHLEEAITGPAEMITYLGQGIHTGKEGNLAYHNSLMVQFWAALATRDTRLMTHVLSTHFPTSVANATYGTYLRCHDDIGWAVTDEDAAAAGLDGFRHRQFLADFYEGRFPGSFARGAFFQINEETGDKRNCGTMASLSGLGRALESGDAEATRHAIHRILMGHALIASYGGIPFIYMGDEIAMLNDWSYVETPEHAHDSRWLHRPRMDWEALAEARAGDGVAGQVFHGLRHIMARRKATPELHGGNPTVVTDTGQPGLFAFVRETPAGSLVCVFNFTENWTSLPRGWAEAHGVRQFHDALSDAPVALHDDRIALPPYARVWLR